MGSEYWDGIRRRRISRRRALAAGALGTVGVGLAAAVGCGDDDDDDRGGDASDDPRTPTAASSSAFPNARRSPKLISVINDPPQTLDFHSTETPGSHQAPAPAYNGLIYRIEDRPGHFSHLDPELAEEWEQPDELTTILRLRKGVRFHDVEPTDGRDFTAEDVKYNIERMRGEHPRGNQVPGEFRMRDMFAPIERMEVVDDHTLRLTTAFPFAPLLNDLSFSWVQIIPRELVEASGDRNVLTWAVGTGPWILEGYDTLGDGGKIRYVINPDYWKPGQPFFDAFELPIVTSSETIQAMFLNDQTDLSYSIDAATTLSLRENKPEIALIEIPGNGALKLYFDMSNTDSPWAREKRLRQAMYYLMPYDALLQGVGVDCCRTGPMPLNREPWSIDEAELPAAGLPFTDSLAEAQRLMAEAGFPSGTEIPLELSISQFYGGTFLGEALAGIFGSIRDGTAGAVNLKPDLKVLELGDWLTGVYRGGSRYMATTHADWGWDDPDNGFFRYFHSDGVANNTHFNSAEADRLIEEQRREFDVDKRAELVLNIQRLLLDEAPVIFIISPNNFGAIQPWVENARLMFLNNVEYLRHYDEIWYNEKAPNRGT